MPKTGGQLIAECLDRNQVRKVFCVPGESYLGALDALFDKKKSIKRGSNERYGIYGYTKYQNIQNIQIYKSTPYSKENFHWYSYSN